MPCPLPCTRRSLTALRQELRSFLAETELPRSRVPTATQLQDAGRGDLVQARGWGARRVAR